MSVLLGRSRVMIEYLAKEAAAQIDAVRDGAGEAAIIIGPGSTRGRVRQVTLANESTPREAGEATGGYGGVLARKGS